MVVNHSIQIEDQINLRIEKEISRQMDSIIEKMRITAKEFNIANADKRSPFRNVLAVAVEPGSSLEVIKNYIRYQVGRKESSPIWKLKKGDNLFAELVVNQIDALSNDTQETLQRVGINLADNEEVSSYLNNEHNLEKLKQELHLKFAQLYLGYLAREHTALVGEAKNK